MASSTVLSLLFLLHLIAAVAAAPAAAQLHLWSHKCIDDYGNYTSNSTFKSNLDNLLTKISTTHLPYGFYNFSFGKDPDQAYAIALCRGDVDVADCHTCIDFAISKLTGLCPNQNEVIGCTDKCMLRYSNRDILGGLFETFPTLSLVSGTYGANVDHFINVLQSLLESLPNRTASGDSRLKFATGEANVSANHKVYALTQCTPDLSSYGCLGCLYRAIYCLLHWQGVAGKIGVRAHFPSCSARYELHKFYSSLDPSTPTPYPVRSNIGNGEFNMVVIVVLGVLGCVSVLVNFLCCWLRQTTKANKMTAVELEDGDEATPIKSLQLDFNTIRDATKVFSEANH